MNTSANKQPLSRLLALGKDQSKNLDDRLTFLDSAYIVSHEWPIDSLSLSIVATKSFLHLQQGQNDSFFFYNKYLAKKSIAIDNGHLLGRAYFNIGYYFDELTNHIDSAFYYYNRSKNSYIKLGDSIQAGRRLMRMATLQNIQNDFYGSKETLTEALRYLGTKDRKYRASVLNELGTNNRKLLNFPDAARYYGEAIATTDSKSDVLTYKNNLATSFSEEGKYNLSLKLFEELLMDSLLTEGSIRHARILHNQAFTRWRNGETGVDTLFFKALETRKIKNDGRGQISSYTDLGEYFSVAHPNKAKKYLDTAIQLSRQLQIPKAETDALQLLMQLKPGNTAYKDRYIFLKDSLYDNELRVKTQFAKMKYDDEQEKERILLLETETAERRAEVAEQKNQKIIVLSLSGLFLMGGASFFLIFRQKHKKEKLQEVYNTEKRISQRLHDGLANDVFSLMTQVENVEHPKNKTFLNVLENIYKLTREISHENSAILTGTEFSNEIRNLLKPFHGKNTTIVIKGLDDVEWPKLEEHKCVAVHRSLKEVMVNMKKHSQASLVVIDFKKDKKNIKIHYKDNGVGCTSDQKFGVGLANTVSRIQNSNGTFIFTPNNGKGVEIRISIPY